jgi:hypothetical protein
MSKNSGGSLGFNGQDNTDLAAKGSGKYAKNQHTGHSNDGRLVNMGRGPTVGNKDTTTHCCPAPTSAHGKEQKRGQGGAYAKCPTNPDHINYGKQMTKGNS